MMALLLLFAFFLFPAHEQTQTRDGLTARLSVATDAGLSPREKVEARLSGELIVTLIVESNAGIEVAPVPVLTRSKAWQQREPAKGWETTKLEDGRIRRRQTYRLSPWAIGDAPLELLPLRYRQARDQPDWDEITWKPIPVVVTTMIPPDADVRMARPITGVELLPAPDEEPGRAPWAWAGLGLAALAAVIWLALRRWRRAPPPVSPDVWAERELARLGEELAAVSPDGERFHTALSGIVRRYLELRFGFNTPRQTTAEFLGAARASPLLTPAQYQLLCELLGQSDLAKFAAAVQTRQECQAALALARGFVAETRPPRAEDAAGEKSADDL